MHEPWRRPPESVVRRGLDVGAAHVLVGVVDIDVPRTGAVGLACDRARERRVLDERPDRERLPRLEVQPDVHGQACVRLEPRVFRHGATIYWWR